MKLVPTKENIELLRTAVAAQIALWNALDALEESLDIKDEDSKTDALSEHVNTLAAGGPAEAVGAGEIDLLFEAIEQA